MLYDGSNIDLFFQKKISVERFPAPAVFFRYVAILFLLSVNIATYLMSNSAQSFLISIDIYKRLNKVLLLYIVVTILGLLTRFMIGFLVP